MVIELLTSRYPGMRLWLSQRLTAVYMAIYLLVITITLLITKPLQYTAWQALASHGLFKLSTLLFFLSLVIHAWLGVRDVLRDYVFNQSMRACLQIVVELLLAAYFIWFCIIIW